MQSVYSTASADWAIIGGAGVLTLCWDVVGIFYSPNRLGGVESLESPFRFFTPRFTLSERDNILILNYINKIV